MARDEKPAAVEENKMATKDKTTAVSATELAQALIEALQQHTAARGETRAVTPGDTIVVGAIAQYRDIAADLETLPLSR